MVASSVVAASPGGAIPPQLGFGSVWARGPGHAPRLQPHCDVPVLPVSLIGSPLNFAACLIGSPIISRGAACRQQAPSGADIVSGTRYAGGGVFGWNFKRKLTSRGANFLAATLLQPGVRALRPAF